MSDNGKFIIDWMNQVGYTALVPGQYDFTLGQEVLNELADRAEFPFIMSNLICNNCSLTSDNIKKYIETGICECHYLYELLDFYRRIDKNDEFVGC